MKQTATVILLTVCSLSFIQAQVAPREKRTQILAEAQAVLHTNVEQYSDAVASIRSPFYIPPKEKPVVEQEEEVEVVKVVSKKAILEIAAKQLSPSGSMSKGDKAFIQSAVGLIPSGSQFKATYSGQQYTVTLVEITEDYYVLTLDDESLKTYFNPDADDRIQKGQNVTDRPGINEIPVLPAQ